MLKQFYNSIVDSLQAIYPAFEAKEIGLRLVEFYLDKTKIDIALEPDADVEVSRADQINASVLRLLDHEPLQYVLGLSDFYDMTFVVDKNVLIPRPETEELVKLIIDDQQKHDLSVLDIGTGSGCIPIALKKNLIDARVSACDISLEALEVAKQNSSSNDVEVDFFQCDILDAKQWSSQTYDVIVSNPPYVLESEKELMRTNVLDYEPHLALFVGDGVPLLFYTAIADFGVQHLNPKGYLYFEINEAFADDTKEMLLNKGYSSVVVYQDLFGKDRMISAHI